MARKYKSYNALELKLRRDGVAKAGTVATLLLDCFVVSDGLLKAKTVENKRVCLPNKFSQWRKELIAKEWLVYEHGSYSRHYPGQKLLKYVNSEKLEYCELATTSQVEKIRKESKENIDSLRKELKKEITEEITKQLIAYLKPPVTKEKVSACLKVIGE